MWSALYDSPGKALSHYLQTPFQGPPTYLQSLTITYLVDDSKGSGARPCELKPQLHNRAAGRSSVCYLATWCLHFPICKGGTAWINVHKTHRTVAGLSAIYTVILVSSLSHHLYMSMSHLKCKAKPSFNVTGIQSACCTLPSSSAIFPVGVGCAILHLPWPTSAQPLSSVSH